MPNTRAREVLNILRQHEAADQEKHPTPRTDKDPETCPHDNIVTEDPRSGGYSYCPDCGEEFPIP